jgi:hypothetical protein
VAAGSEVRGDEAEGGQEPLGRADGVEAFHGPFALPGGLVGVLASVIQVLRSLSVTITRGTYRNPFSSLRKNLVAALAFRRVVTRMSRTFPNPSIPRRTRTQHSSRWTN